MTYYYKDHGMMIKVEGEDPPDVDEYTAIDKQGVVRHIQNGEVVEERKIVFPSIAPRDDYETRRFYNLAHGFLISKEMLRTKYRKKSKSKSKTKRRKNK